MRRLSLLLGTLLIISLALVGCRTSRSDNSASASAKPDSSASSAASVVSVTIPLFSGTQALPVGGEDHEVTLAFPAIGGAVDRSLFLRFHVRDGRVVGTPTSRFWLQQTGMQPSHISRQKREVTLDTLAVTPEGVSGPVLVEVTVPAQLGQPAITDRFELRLNLAPQPGEPLPNLRTDYSTPSWRRIDLPLAGELLRGEVAVVWTHTRGAAETRKEFRLDGLGSWQPLAAPGGPWTTRGDGTAVLTRTGESHRFSAVLPTRRTDAADGVSFQQLWPERRDLRAANAFLVTYRVETPHPLAAYDLEFEESPGTWYVARRALPLATAGTHTTLIPFSGLAQSGWDMDHWFTPTSVGGQRVAVRSGEGIGAVSLDLLSIEAVLAQAPGLPARAWSQAPAEPARIGVALDRVRVRHGVRGVPDGLFGAHVVGLPEDAAVPLPRGVRHARTIVHANFAGRPGARDRDEARDYFPRLDGAPGDRLMESWTWGPLFGYPHWLENPSASVRPVAEYFAALAAAHGPATGAPDALRRIEFWNEPFMWARHINLPGGKLADSTQHTYLPGKLSADAYVLLFNAASDAARSIDPAIQLGGPSSASFNADDWRHLTDFVLPLVTGAGERLSFVAEHHYQGRGPQFAAEYDVFQAASVAAVGRRVPVWNTECNDLADTPGAQDQPIDFSPNGSSRRRAVYHLGEILAHLQEGFDHTRGRAVHALWKGRFAKQGEADAFALMDGLRGELVPVSSDDPHLLATATRLSATADAKGSVVLYNDGPHARVIVLPGLAAHVESGTELFFDPAADTTLRALAFEKHGDDVRLTLPALGAAALTLRELPAARDQHETVRYARGALWRIAPGESLALEVPEATLGARRVRYVAEEIGEGEATLRLGPVTVTLPRTDDGPLALRSLDLPPGADVSRPTVTLTPDGGGGRIASLSFEWID